MTDPIYHRAVIQSGVLDLTLTENGHRLDELLTFASRRNPRRGYLFVSRVLGKHIPVRPSKMDSIHAELAEAIGLLGTTPYVVGMAETAVGLGAGVARHLAKRHGGAVYHHTTRFQVSQPWVRIKEAHSHADTMHMAHLAEPLQDAVADTRDIVLVDDEISTGKTLAQLAQALSEQPELAKARRLHIVALVSWLSDDARNELLALLPEGLDVRFVQLMAGTFTFTPASDFTPTLPDNVDTEFCDVLMNTDDESPAPLETEGLYGKWVTQDAEKDQPEANPVFQNAGPISLPVVVFGMGEHLDRPFRLSLKRERLGHDVLYQSSTRSPIMLGEAIASCIEHPAPGRPGKRHFLYNAPSGRVPLAFDGINCPDVAEALEYACIEWQGRSIGGVA